MSLDRRLVTVIAAALLLAAAACVRGGAPAPVVRHGKTAERPAPQAQAQPQDRYVVRAGDTVFSIARAQGVSTRALIDANRLRPPYVVSVGQRLTVPPPRLHVVARGDTLYGISRRYGVDMANLARRNGLTPPYTIQVGQRLALPGVAPPVSSPATVVATAPATPPLAEATPRRRPSPPGSVAAVPPQAETKSETGPAPRRRPPPPIVASGPLPEPPARTGNGFLWPVQGRVVAAYGLREGNRHNDGINIAAPAGTPVRAAENGVVAYAGDGIRGFGNLLLIKHDRGYITAYAHNARLLVGRGQVVRQGEAVATVGATGGVPSPQLHFEIRRGTKAVDPSALLRGT